MATIFSISEPRDVPFYKGRAGRTITDENVSEFWEANADVRNRRGCYVFGIRAGKGWTPGYVGKATRSFKQETFGHHKLTRYQQFLVEYAKGTPVIFFVMFPVQKGKPHGKHIGDLEDFLIQTAVGANPDLMNIKGTKAEEWGIAGILRSGKGKPSKAARSFKQLLKLT